MQYVVAWADEPVHSFRWIEGVRRNGIGFEVSRPITPETTNVCLIADKFKLAPLHTKRLASNSNR